SARLTDGTAQPGSDWWEAAKARIDQLQRLERRFDTILLAKIRRKFENNPVVVALILIVAVLGAIWKFVPISAWDSLTNSLHPVMVVLPGSKEGAGYLVYVKSESGSFVPGTKVVLQGISTVVSKLSDNLGLVRFEIPLSLPTKVEVIGDAAGY